jgi:hypothetical protein
MLLDDEIARQKTDCYGAQKNYEEIIFQLLFPTAHCARYLILFSIARLSSGREFLISCIKFLVHYLVTLPQFPIRLLALVVLTQCYPGRFYMMRISTVFPCLTVVCLTQIFMCPFQDGRSLN